MRERGGLCEVGSQCGSGVACVKWDHNMGEEWLV